MKRLCFGLCILVLALSTSFFPVQAEKTTELKVLTFFNPDQPPFGISPQLKEFQKKYPSIRPTAEYVPYGEFLSKVYIYATAGEVPDIVMPVTRYVTVFASKGILEPLDDIAKTENFNIGDVFVENWLNFYKYEGNLYGLPWDNTVQALFYNKKMFDESGLEYPGRNFYYEDIIPVGEKLTKDTDGDGEIDQWGLADYGLMKYFAQFITWQWNGGARLLNDEHTECLFNSPESIEIWQLYIDTLNKYKIRPRERLSPTNLPRLLTQEVAMWLDSTDLPIGADLNAPEFTEWDVAWYPHRKGAPRAAFTTGCGYSIGRDANKEWAFRLITEALLSKETLLPVAEGGKLCARKDLMDKCWQRGEGKGGQNMRSILQHTLEYGGFYPSPLHPEIDKMLNIITRELERAELEIQSVKKAADRITREINLLLKK